MKGVTESPTVLGMFAKYWEPGKVKTRLARSIGPDAAGAVYLAFLKTLLWRFGSDCAAGRAELLTRIAITPWEKRDAFASLAEQQSPGGTLWEFCRQSDGDLGQRIEHFFATAFEQTRRAILIGTDSPTLPASRVNQAAWLLKQHEVVLGPTEDGGYYLVAAREQVPPIFSDISWSTEQVWRQTVTRLQEARVKFAVLPTWYDVDEIEDLERLLGELSDTLNQNAETDERFATAQRLTQELKATGEIDELLSRIGK